MKQIVGKRDDIAFYMKMFPILQLHPAAYDKSRAIVCQKDNKKAIKLLEDAYAKRDLPKPDCVTDVVKNNIDLAGKLGISGTPTLIFADGYRHNGLIAEDELLKLIEAHKGK